MPISAEQFVDLVSERVPEARFVVSEHLADYDGDLLLHLLMPDLLRFTVEKFHERNEGVAQRCLDVVTVALLDGDTDVQNAVAVSFVEHAGLGEGETPEFLASWPPALLAEHQRMNPSQLH